MAGQKDTYALLRYYSVKHKTPMIDFPYFLYFVQRYAERFKDERPGLVQFLNNTSEVLTTQLKALAEGEMCRLSYEDGRIKRILFPQYYIDLIHETYKDMSSKVELPFPSRESLNVKIPEEVIRTVDVKAEFLKLLENPAEYRHKPLKLVFPDGIREILISVELVQKKLIELSVQKIRLYLSSQRNADYVRHKLLVVFQNRDLILKDTLDSVVTKPEQAAATVRNPTEFTFSFWAHLTNFLTQEYRQKETKLTDEHSYCQAAYLLSYYNVFYKGRIQQEKEEEKALATLYGGFKAPPFAFTVSEVYRFTDKSGVPVTRHISTDRIHSFLESKIIPAEGKALPDLLRFKAEDNSVHYILKDFLFLFLVRLVTRATGELKELYLTRWTENLRAFERTEEMEDDAAFGQDVENRIRERWPILYSLLEYDLLSVASREAAVPADLSFFVENLFSDSRKSLRSANDILSLNRKELLETARLRLSFWELLPSLKMLRSFLRRLFRRKPVRRSSRKTAGSDGSGSRERSRETVLSRQRQPAVVQTTTRKAVVSEDDTQEPVRSSPGGTKSQIIAYRTAVGKLREHYIGRTENLNQRLLELEEKWNPLYDETAKRNLVEDVNSMIRDYLRTLKRGFRVKPPDVQRIESLAETLAENKAFIRIRRKDLFLEYIKLYMVKTLGEK